MQDRIAARQYKQEKALKERTAADKKKDKGELSEDQQFIRRMLKYLNNPVWLKKYLEEPGSERKIVEICQSLAKSLKQHTHRAIRRAATLFVYDALSAEADVFPLVERSTPFDSIENSAKLSMFHK